MKKGDVVWFNGERILVGNFVWDDLYNFLETGKEYRIKEVSNKVGPPGHIYILIDTNNGEIWFPAKSFNYYYSRSLIKMKYNLR